jgi:hypothetical protein
MPNRPIEDIQAGAIFRRSLIERADATLGNAPLWHGWALMDAFLSGIDYERERNRSMAPAATDLVSGD